MLYFAYGSNMSVRRLRMRVPSAQACGVAVLAQHRLAFHKKSCDGSAKCDAFHTGNPDDRVFGVVFEMDAGDKPTLDRAEGLGQGYEEKTVSAVTSQKKTIEAFTYYATDITPTLKPYHWYKKHVLIGAREHQLPGDYIQVIESVDSMDDPLPDRQKRELLIYYPSLGS